MLAGRARPHAPRPQQAGRQQHQGRDEQHRRRIVFACWRQAFFQFGTARTFLPRAVARHHDKAVAAPIAVKGLVQTAANHRQQSVHDRQRHFGQSLLESLQRLSRPFVVLMTGDIECPSRGEPFGFGVAGRPGHQQQDHEQRVQVPRRTFLRTVDPMGLLPDVRTQPACQRRSAGGILSAHEPSLGEWFDCNFHSDEGRPFQLRHHLPTQTHLFQLVKKNNVMPIKRKRLHQPMMMHR